jgi:hypothetical protein
MVGARRRRRPKGPVIVVLVLVLLTAFLALSINAAKPSTQSVHQAARTYLALVYPLVQQSNQAAATVGRIRTDPASFGLPGLESTLDQLVTETEETQRSVAALSVPSALVSQAADLERAMRARAAAARAVRSGMKMALDAGRANAAVETLVFAGNQMTSSDGWYSSFRRAIPGWAGGRRSVPPSAWAPDGSPWGAGPIGQFVSAVASAAAPAPGGSPNPLAVDHDLLLLAVLLQPTPLQTQPSIVVPSTQQLSPTIVVANIGNQTERSVKLQATLQGTPPAASETSTRVIGVLRPGQRVSVRMGSLPVSPGGSYSLTSSITPVPGETVTSNNTLSIGVQVST